MLAAAQVIRAVASRLSGLPLAGSNVYTDRAWPLTERLLPAWKVEAGMEDIAPKTVGPDPLLEHQLMLEVKGYTQTRTGLDDDLHALEVEALTALGAAAQQDPPDALDSLLAKMTLHPRRIDRRMESDGQATHGVTAITLLATFRTRRSAPETLI